MTGLSPRGGRRSGGGERSESPRSVLEIPLFFLLKNSDRNGDLFYYDSSLGTTHGGLPSRSWSSCRTSTFILLIFS